IDLGLTEGPRLANTARVRHNGSLGDQAPLLPTPPLIHRQTHLSRGLLERVDARRHLSPRPILLLGYLMSRHLGVLTRRAPALALSASTGPNFGRMRAPEIGVRQVLRISH